MKELAEAMGHKDNHCSYTDATSHLTTWLELSRRE